MLFIYLCNWYTRSIKLEWEPYNGLAFHQGVAGVVALTVLLTCFDMLFLKSVIVSSINIKVWSCNSVFQFWLVMHYLSEMTEEQTLVMCSGHPQGLFPSSPSAPRAIISNGMVIHISSASVSDTLEKNIIVWSLECVIWFYWVVSEKNPYSPHRRGWKFVGGAGFSKAPNLSKCMKLDWNFQRGGGSKENPFHGAGMDNFWNHTLIKPCSNAKDFTEK